MKKWLGVFLVVGFFTVVGCTENQRTRYFGGTAKIDLPAGQKLVIATWKEVNLWYLTRPMRSDERAEIYEFVESSNLGIIEGKVVFVEHK